MQLLRSDETYCAYRCGARWLRCNGAESLRGEYFPGAHDAWKKRTPNWNIASNRLELSGEVPKLGARRA